MIVILLVLVLYKLFLVIIKVSVIFKLCYVGFFYLSCKNRYFFFYRCRNRGYFFFYRWCILFYNFGNVYKM